MRIVGSAGGFSQTKDPREIAYFKAHAALGQEILVLDILDTFPTYFAFLDNLPDYVACLVPPPASSPVAGRTRSQSHGPLPSYPLPGSMPPAARHVAGARRPRRGRRDPGPPSPADTSHSSLDGSDRDLVSPALLNAQADLAPHRWGGSRGRHARGV